MPEQKSSEIPVTENNTAEINASFLPEEITKQQEVHDSALKPEDMEVHYHPHLHHQSKEWKEYFLEFMMIFFAVTMGFFAENMRERITNNEKEEHYIHSLAEDVKADTAQLHGYIRFKKAVYVYCDSLQSVILHTNVFKNSNSLYTYSRELARYVLYYPSDRTIEQLKNGNMHLIHTWEVSNAISEYYSRTKFMQEVDRELNDEVVKYRTLLIELLDLASYDKLNDPGSFMDINVKTKGNPAFISANAEKIKIMYNEAFALKAYLHNCIQAAEELAKDGDNLLTLLHKEYTNHA